MSCSSVASRPSGRPCASPTGPWLGAPRIDVDDALGFELAFAGRGEQAEAEVVDVAPADRHLLLLVRREEEKAKFLCGHDERHWFVAAIPEDARGVTGVETAKAALQPAMVAARAARLPRKRRFDRRNPVYLRQGEWFFLPEPHVWAEREPDPAQRAAGASGRDPAHPARGVPPRWSHRVCQRRQGDRPVGVREALGGPCVVVTG